VGAGPGVSYRTALNWFLAGTLPVSARQLPTGTILVEPSAGPSGETVAYCGVSSAEQGDDVERQAGRVAEEAGGRGITLDATVSEVGSGWNGNRVTLRKILADPQVSGIVVEHRDRRARVQAYRFAVDPTPTQEAVLRSHCGAQRFAFNWGLALVTAVMNQRKAEASYAHRGRSAHAVVVVVGLQPAENLEPDEGHHRAVVGGELERGVLVGPG
jgi:hypothetical protein